MNSVKVIQSKKITSPHGFSTRTGGVSTGIFESLNLGMNRGDKPDLVTMNWDLFLRECNIGDSYDKGMIPFVCGNQVHGNTVLSVSKDDLRVAYGKYPENYISELINKNIPLSQDNLLEADGFVTNEPFVPLAIFTADCTPLLLEDSVNKVIGAVHCGWRSTALDIMNNAVIAMEKLGAKRNHITAAIGPAICKDCFEVGKEVVDAMENLLGNSIDNLYTMNKSGKYLLDLKSVVKERLIQIGVPSENIDDVNECTMCRPDIFWSHRITGFDRGSQANAIMISTYEVPNQL